MSPLRLRSLNGPRPGQEFSFAGPRVRIGRSRDNDLVLDDTPDPQASAHHADAVHENGAWWIVDGESRNGTYVNSRRIERERLNPGDVVAVGDHQFVVAGGRKRMVWPAVAAVVVAAVFAAVYAARRPASSALEDIATRAARAVYAIEIEEGGRRLVAGTSFAIGADGVLATNAHLADAIRQRPAFAVRSDTFDTRRIVGVSVHPKWKSGSVAFDTALLQLEAGPPIATLTIAVAEASAHLQRGMRIASFGFPAVSTIADRPRGRLAVDVVGDVRGDYIQTGLAISPGTSGSPVFDETGQVVAIVAGGDFVSVDGKVGPTGSAANWAISASLVRELLPQR